MFKLFIQINTKIWKDSLTGLKIFSFVIYALLGLLFFGQFVGIALLIMFAPNIEVVQELYPWFTEEMQFFAHLFFINSIWFTQLFFTKISRLHLSENRKFLAFGMPLKKLTNYLNIAGFLQPIHLFFSIFWIFYLGLFAQTFIQYFIVILLVVVNYGIISSFKWRLKNASIDYLKLTNALMATVIIALVVTLSYVDLNSTIGQPERFADLFLPWIQFTPGGLLYTLSGHPFELTSSLLIIALLTAALVTLSFDLYYHTKSSLLNSFGTQKKQKVSKRIRLYTKIFGRQGAKFFHSVWSHSYTKNQLLITFVITGMYIFLFHDGTSAGDVIVGVFLTFIPVMILMLFMTNMFGFENRELLLVIQSPVKTADVAIERVKTSLICTIFGFAVIVITTPFLYSAPATNIQIYTGALFICLVFLNYLLHSSIKNYEKIEDVQLSSLSNPVIPASVTFTAMFIILLLGLVSFPVINQFQWTHIILLSICNCILLYLFWKRLRNIINPFKSQVVPRLWNEL